MTPDDDDIQTLAGEYVLGLQSARRRQDVERRMADDRKLQDAVLAWEHRLAALNETVAPEEPSPRVWQMIERHLDPDTKPATVARPESAGGFRRWLQDAVVWRRLTIASCALSLVLASVLVSRLWQPDSSPTYMVVLLAPQDKTAGWVVQATSDGKELELIPMANVVVPPGKSLQFWTKADSWTAPVSLGLVQPGNKVRVPIKSLPALQAQQLFELTLEPEKGSPIGRPTGPVQYIGRAVSVL